MMLEGKEIVLAVTGSIAATESVHLVHALRRRGASVTGVMSGAATRIINPDVLGYATGRDVITRLTGKVEHVALCGEGGSADLLLIAPCTASTIAKIATGIGDTPPTTFAITAIGRGMPVVVVPAMHISMYRHPAIRAHLERLREWGVVVVDPSIEEGKAKIAGIEEIVLHVERACPPSPLDGRHVLIACGPCMEPVDDVRVITTRSTGRMGRELALQAFRLGADVTVVHRDRFPAVRNVYAETAAGMHREVMRIIEEGGVDYYLSPAAISDLAPHRQPGKIPGGAEVTLTLDPLPKLIDRVLEHKEIRTVAFKLGSGGDEEARALIGRGAAVVVADTPAEMGAEEGRFVIHTPSGRREIRGTKEEVAAVIWDELP
ncbi:MAG: bifunctional phosphopantothenoylcysteine decarboxylase/phosphopantothenate--cysteine ligase CoaBC [Methanoculleaceae archaeon]